MMDKRLIQIMGGVLLLLIVIVIGYNLMTKNTPSDFDKQKVLASSELKSVPALEKDYDTDEMQVRHLSWGKLNYYPEEITVKAGKKVQIVGDLKRLQGCFRSLVIPEFKVQGQITEQNNVIEFVPDHTGTFGFGCAMGMGNGKLIVA